jgi:putative aldouronate transport system substrate-binding protein
MKKVFSLVLAMLMLCTLFTACNNSGNSAATPSPSVVESPVAPSVAPQEEIDLSLPIVTDGSITLEWWVSVAPEVAAVTSDFADGKNYSWTELMKRTGINLNFVMPSWATEKEQFNLMINSGDYPDIANTNNSAYAGGADKAVEDEVWLRLNELAEKYAPNYLALVNANEGNVKNNLTDSGNMIFFCQIYDRNQPTFAGYGIRQNWLDDLGLERPITYDDWHKTLTAFKDEKTGGKAPLDMAATGFAGMNWFTGGFGVSTSTDGYAIQKDGVVSSSIISDGYREYLELMSSWYKEGLLDPDFVSGTGYYAMGFGPDGARMWNDITGACAMLYSFSGTFLADSGQAKPGTVMTLCPLPRKNANEDPKITGKGKFSTNMAGGSGAVIFATCEYPAEATRMIDYLYSPEGALLANYGVEGITFNYDDAGKPKRSDLIMKNPDGLDPNIAQQVYMMHTGPLLFMLDRDEETMTDYGREYYDLWNIAGEWNISGNLTYTAEEGERIATLATDIKTYVEEFNCKVITGTQELTDDSWNAFVAQVKSMGIDELISIIQGAYDRYIAR